MKKLTSILLALLMALTLLPTAVFATETVQTWTKTDSLPEYGTYKLMNDVSLTKNVVIDNKTLTLDLNGHSITPATNYTSQDSTSMITVKGGATLTINDTKNSGKIDTTDAKTYNYVEGSNAAKQQEIYAPIIVLGTGESNNTPTKLIVNGGTFKGYYYGIVGNGSDKNWNTDITINGGTFGGYATNDNYAIYHPQKGTLTINGGNLTGGACAVEIRAGELVVNGGTFESTASAYSCNANGNGTTTVGAALAISQHTTKKDIKVTITNGTFTGVKALNESNPQNNDPAPQVNLTVNGGTFNGGVSIADSKDAKISSGEFTDLANAIKYAANNATIKLAGDVTLTEMVTLNKDLTIDLNGHKLSRNDGNSIVQVINNKTLTIDGTTANSQVYGRINVGIADNNNGNVVLNGGTYSCGKGENEAGQTVLHINGTCKNSNVTIKNATITSPDDNAVQLNGGGTFVIENSTITGATAVYVKSGNLTVKDSTLTGNKNPVNYSYNGNGADATGDGMVIDSCDYPAGAPIVTIENTKVTGSKAAVGTYEILKADKAASHTNATVSLKSGTFTGGKDYPSVSTKVTGDGITASNITITGGTFTVNPAEYVNDKNFAVTKGTDGKYTVGASTGTSSVVLPTTGGSESSTSTSTSASIPASDIDANKELVIKNDTATTSVTFNSTAAESIKNKGDLTLTVTTEDGKNNTNVDDSNKTAYTEATKNTSTTNAVVVSIDLKDNDGKNVFTGADGAYAIVTVPYKTGMKNVTVHHLGANGAVTKLGLANSANLTANDTFYYDSVNGVITMRLAHFSQYLINAEKVSTPYRPRPIGTGTTTTTTTGKAQSPTTFDAGIAIYGVMTVSSVLGMGYMGKKKFF